MNILIAIVIGILTGISIAALVGVSVLEKYISFGDSKGEFENFSKFPIRMISQSDGNNWFKV